MHPLLTAALDEAAPMIAARGWTEPSPSTLADARRLLDLVANRRAPTVQVEPDGSVRFDWDAADLGWLSLVVDGRGEVAHRAVIGEDEFERSEAFGAALPEWAGSLLTRLMSAGH